LAGLFKKKSQKGGRALHLFRAVHAAPKPKKTKQNFRFAKFLPRHPFPTFLCHDSVYPLFAAVQVSEAVYFLP
jgi:predicted NAD/FAD-binding protein